MELQNIEFLRVMFIDGRAWIEVEIGKDTDKE